MTVRPTVRGVSVRQQETPVNGVAVLIFLVLTTLAILIAIPMGMSDVHWIWIIGELVILNLIGVYILIAFSVPPPGASPFSRWKSGTS